MSALELADIQGLIIRAYANLPKAAYLLLRVKDAIGVRKWLETIAKRITPADISKPENATNIAFTISGLTKLGLNDTLLAMFAPEFQETMSEWRRSKVLGDIGKDDPKYWQWGNPDSYVDIILMVYAADDNTLEQMLKDYRAGIVGILDEVSLLPTIPHKDGKEHFGFMDGISQPTIAGLDRVDDPRNIVNPGEFILGYKNQYDKYPDSILLPKNGDPRNLLCDAEDRKDYKDLGRNGSYLVFRQMSQDPKAFWKHLADEAEAEKGSRDDAEMIALGSKIVGRRPDGVPLASIPESQTELSAEEIAKIAFDNTFQYHDVDPYGDRCPIGSHIRRSNPRNSLVPGPEESIIVSNRHRLLRRGRSYGDPVAESMEPTDILNAPADTKERGLHFICFNTSIGRQFEFVQQTWINSRKFAGLYSDADPALGECRLEGSSDEQSTFTIPGTPLRRRLACMPKFTNVVGGAYFFMPGIKALNYLAALGGSK